MKFSQRFGADKDYFSGFLIFLRPKSLGKPLRLLGCGFAALCPSVVKFPFQGQAGLLSHRAILRAPVALLPTKSLDAACARVLFSAGSSSSRSQRGYGFSPVQGVPRVEPSSPRTK